jgi:hypothetical protein
VNTEALSWNDLGLILIATLPQASYRQGGVWEVSHRARIGFTGERMRGRAEWCVVIVMDCVSVSSVLCAVFAPDRCRLRRIRTQK